MGTNATEMLAKLLAGQDLAEVEAAGLLRDMAGGGPVEIHVGGVVLIHRGGAAALVLRTGMFGRQADDENGRFLRAAMDRFGISRNIELGGSATSVAEIFVDDKGGRAIYMAPGLGGRGVGLKLLNRLVDDCTAGGWRQLRDRLTD